MWTWLSRSRRASSRSAPRPARAAAAWAATLAAGNLLACAGPEKVETPSDLEGLLRFFWTQQSSADDETLGEALRSAVALSEELLQGEKTKVGALDPLDESDLAALQLDDGRDPREAVGFFLVNRFRCGAGTLEEIVTSPDQAEIHPGVYDRYERAFDTPRAAFIAGDDASLDWRVTYAATPLATQYEAKTRSGVRRIPADPSEPSSTGLLQRTFLAEPAAFAGAPDNHAFDQDYQVELYAPLGGGEVVHLYGLWRHMQLGLVGVRDDVFIDVQLSGFVQWDQHTEDTCATWPALPQD